MTDAVLYRRDGRIGVITLNRPDNLNSMTPDLLSAFAGAIDIAKNAPALGIGVHLNLSDGKPISDQPVPTLTNEQGDFSGGPETLLLRLARRSLLLKEIELEWEAQIEKVRLAGISPTHLDGHKHVHMLPGLFEIALRLAKRNNIAAIRVAHEASSLRAALSTDDELFDATVFKQGVQARGLKLLARDARGPFARDVSQFLPSTGALAVQRAAADRLRCVSGFE